MFVCLTEYKHKISKSFYNCKIYPLFFTLHRIFFRVICKLAILIIILLVVLSNKSGLAAGGLSRFLYLCPCMEKLRPYAVDDSTTFESLVMGDVKAGFPSPAEDIRERLDIVKLLVRHKASTFFFRIDGVSMVDEAMDDGDIIIVDRAIEPYNNCKAVCYIDGEYTVKRVEIGDSVVRLMPANEQNSKYKPIEVSAENNFMIWGVVTYVIKRM